MKTVEFEGKKFEVNDWIKYIAQDTNGAIWAFEKMPFSYSGEWDTSYGLKQCLNTPISYKMLIKEV